MEIKRPASQQPIPPHAKPVFRGKIFEVYQWEQELYDGSKATFEKLKRPDTAMVIAVTPDKQIILADQEQPGKSPFVGFLGGRVDEGEDPLRAAQRELWEESGYTSDHWSLLDTIQPLSKIDWVIYTFIARDCIRKGDQTLEPGERIKLRQVSFEELEKIVIGSEFNDPRLQNLFLQAKLDPQKMAELRRQILD